MQESKILLQFAIICSFPPLLNDSSNILSKKHKNSFHGVQFIQAGAFKAFPLCGRPESQNDAFAFCANRLVVTPRRWLRMDFRRRMRVHLTLVLPFYPKSNIKPKSPKPKSQKHPHQSEQKHALPPSPRGRL